MVNKILLFTIVSFLLIGSVGCKKEASEIEFLKQQIIGTWEWIVSYGGVVGESQPIPGEKLELTFTNNRIMATHNLEIIDDEPVITDKKIVMQDGNYIISKEQDIFYLTIIPKEGSESLLYLAGKNEFIFDHINGSLIFPFSIGTAQFCTIYKKNNE